MAMIPYYLTESERKTYRRYASLALPRHTSYPVASAWRTDYGAADFLEDLGHKGREPRPLSVYVHIPFCERLCYFCACTKEIVPAGKRALGDPGDSLLAGLETECGRLAEAAGHREVRQVHLGGGSPTFLQPAQLERLADLLRCRFSIAAGAEKAVELDPRTTTYEQLKVLRAAGFNRVSVGVQDFAPEVQRAVHRIQPFPLVERLVAWCRGLGFTSVNFDLIYGLPFQTLASMADTLDKTLTLAPDRVAFYRLAAIPEMFRWQNAFRPDDLPGGDLPLELNLLAINRFLEAGYEFIGLDHFAKPEEGLARARRDGSLRRTFQGMTTGKNLEVLGLGPSAISLLDGAFAQNFKTSAAWMKAVAIGMATERGLRLTADDRIRRELLEGLYAHGVIDKRVLEMQFKIVFDDYFAGELRHLQRLVDDGLTVHEPDAIRLTSPLGRLLVRIVAAVFDRYLPPTAYQDGLPVNLSSRVG
jgi:oxygen-independent coproporphyrinogen-3 oxidase